MLYNTIIINLPTPRDVLDFILSDMQAARNK